jgi:hypothetical protein
MLPGVYCISCVRLCREADWALLALSLLIVLLYGSKRVVKVRTVPLTFPTSPASTLSLPFSPSPHKQSLNTRFPAVGKLDSDPICSSSYLFLDPEPLSLKARLCTNVHIRKLHHATTIATTDIPSTLSTTRCTITTSGLPPQYYYCCSLSRSSDDRCCCAYAILLAQPPCFGRDSAHIRHPPTGDT